MKKQTLTGVSMALFVLALTVGMASTATAEQFNDSESSDVDVEVASTTALDVKPDQLTYNGVEVGERVTETDNSHGFSTLQIENTGSEAIDQIWMATSFPNNDPFGQGDTSAHDSANFLQVKPSNSTDATEVRGDEDVFHYVQRVEYFEDDYPLVETGTLGEGDSANDANNLSVGRIRAGNNEFYFALEYGDTSCDVGQLRVADTPTTPGTLGTVDFSDSGDDYTSYDVSAVGSGDSYGITNTTVDLGLTEDVTETQQYDILSKCDSLGDVAQEEPHIILSKYNIEAGGADNLNEQDGSATTQLWRSDANDLSPGQQIGADVAVQVPRGVPVGSISTGTLTVYSQAASFSP